MSLKSSISFFALAVCLGAIIYYGLITDSALPDHPLIRGFNDLVFHALAFFVLTIPCCVLFGLRAGSVVIWLTILFVEAAQIPMAGRQASIEDILSGGAGWLVASLLVLALSKVR